MSKSKTKSLTRLERMQRRQAQLQREAALQAALRGHQNPKNAFSRWIKRLHRLRDVPAEQAYEKTGAIAQLFLDLPKSTHKRDVFKDLLLQVSARKCYRLLSSRTFLFGLHHIADNWGSAVRDISAWRHTGYSADRQVISLVRHLFVKYPVPAFLYRAWFPGGTNMERWWFIELAAGASVRKLTRLPIPLTRRMAFLFMQAPDWCSISGALRYAQVVALGGDEWLAWHINRSHLGQNGFRDDDFWITVIRFLAGASMLDGHQINAIVDYINHRRVLEPGFSMKGRTPNALLRQVEAWQAGQNRLRNRGGALVWQGSGIREGVFETAGGDGKWLRLTELLSSNELEDEGKDMSHCVYSYAWSCSRGRCAIFSLRLEDLQTQEQERLATIEVDMRTYRVVQVRARFNASPRPDHSRVIVQWAAGEGLLMAKWT